MLLVIFIFYFTLIIFINYHCRLVNNLHNGDLGPAYSHGRSRSGAEDNSEPPRPPPPRPEGNKKNLK